MDFVSADRSRDAEFQANLKDYNFGVAEQNRQITKDVKDTKDKLKQDLGNITNLELEEQIKAGAQQGAELLGATKTFEAIQSGVKKAKGVQQTVTDAVGKIKAVQGNVEGSLDQASETVGQLKDAATESLEQASSEAKAGAGAVSETAGQSIEETQEAAETVAERSQTVKPSAEVPPVEEGVAEAKSSVNEVASGLKTTAEGVAEEGGSLLGKFGSVGARGLGAVGAVGGMAMSIASDENGGWAKKSIADKIGNVVNIGGAGLDLAGLVLEATPLAPLGLALQGFGTLAQIGSGIESEVSSEMSAGKERAAVKKAAAGVTAPPPQALVSGIGSAGAGTLGVARESQF